MSAIVKGLKADHELLRKQLVILKEEKPNFAKKRAAFDKLVPTLTAHASAEEKVVYSFMKSHDELSSMALEGEEEHHLVDLLVAKVTASQEEEKYCAKAKVLAELLEHHLLEEEEVVFPKLEKVLSKAQSEELAKQYAAIRNLTSSSSSTQSLGRSYGQLKA